MVELKDGYCQYLIPPNYAQCRAKVKPPKRYCGHHPWNKRISNGLKHRCKTILQMWKVILAVSTIWGLIASVLTWYSYRYGATLGMQTEILSRQEQGFASVLGEISLRNIEDDLDRQFPMGYTLIVIGRKTIVPYTRRQPDWLQVSWGQVVVDEITDDYVLLQVPVIVDDRDFLKWEDFDYICERTPGARVREPKMPIFHSMEIHHKEGAYRFSPKLIKDSKDLLVVAFVLELMQE